MTVGVAHVLAVLLIQPPADGVVGHYGRCGPGRPGQVKGALNKGLQVVFKVIPRVNRVAPEGVVGVPAALAGGPAGPVLGHGADAVLSPAVLLTLGSL